MKKQITKILLGTSLLIGGQALSQSDIPQKETFGLELISHDNLDLFKVKIYPNPSFISTVKMVWPDWAEITEVKMINISSNQERIIEVEEGERKIMVSGLDEGTYVVKFLMKNLILGSRKIKVIN